LACDASFGAREYFRHWRADLLQGGLTMIVKNKPGLFQRFYLLEALKGLRITIAKVFQKKVTIQYPEERREYSDRFRGMHYIKSVNGVENCTACMLCPTVCPAECIHIEAGEREDKEKYPVTFEIDALRCCFCGMCEEACPKDAIKLSNIYEMSQTTREAYDKEFLMEQRGHK
jgi:NADH-quinone oxidoreductase chain I